MTRRLIPLVAVLASIAFAACSDEPARTTAPDLDALENRDAAENAPIYLVMFKEGVDVPSGAADLSRRAGAAARFVWPVARGFSAAIPESRIDDVRGDPRVSVVSRNGIVQLPRPIRGQAPPWCADNPNDRRCGGSDGGDGGGQTTPWGIARVGGPGGTADGSAWVIDTGVDLKHADLNVDRSCSANFVTRGKNSPADGHGHGTHVAGTIAAIDNSTDVVGVAPGTRICAVRVLDNSGSGTWEWVINGVEYVGANAVAGDVANMSLGGRASGGGPNALERAIMNAVDASGVRFAIAAGNSGEDANNHTPARLDYPNVYTVSAIDSGDCMPSWSNYGNPPVEWAEPGVGILSTKKGGGTTTMSGTSMATPHLAGLLLLGGPTADGNASCDPDGNPDAIGTL